MSLERTKILGRTVWRPIPCRPAMGTPVLLASARSEDLLGIPTFLRREQWMLIKVATWTDVLQVASAVILPVVLCDRELPGLEWPHGLAQLQQSIRPPALVLLSDLTAPGVWRDLVHYGGFDMLFRPLTQERLVAALDLARTHWEMRLDLGPKVELQVSR